MATIDYAGMLYEQSNGLEDIVRASRGMVARAGAKINVLLFACGGDPASEFSEWVPADRHPKAAKRGGKQVLSMDGEDGVPVRVAVAGGDKTPAIYYALSDCPSTLFKNRFASLVGRRVPTLSRVVLSNAEMIEVLNGIVKNGFDVRVKYTSTSTRRKGRLDSHTSHISEPCEEFIGRLKGGDNTVKTIKIACTPAGLASDEEASVPATLTMTRDCRFSATRSAKILFDEVLPRVAEMAESRTERFRSAAKAAGGGTPEPVIINFGRDIFADPARNKDHIDALASMPRSGISVYHANPYIHATLVDYSDCSSYDIWVLVSDKLAIVPQLAASESSLGRLVNHIFEKMGGGRIERYDGEAAE